MAQDTITISKYLSYILRHGAQKEQFQIDSEGFISVDEIIKRKGYNLDQIKFVVENNDKKRFYLKEVEGKYFIRANQGHTVVVENLELKPILDPKEIPVAVHGTNFNAWEQIKIKGLSRMSRNHIHLASGEFGDPGVISGVRKSAKIMVFIDTAKAMNAGMKFFLSTNGVILTEGFDGIIPPEFISHMKSY